MTLPPPLNGKTGMALSVSSLLGLFGVGGAVLKDRIEIGEELAVRRSMLENHERRLDSLETPGGRTVMATETARRLDELTRRIEALERNRP